MKLTLSVNESRIILGDCTGSSARLAWTLGFHYAVSESQARRLLAENFYWNGGVPIEFQAARTARWDYWFFPIRRGDQSVFADLLPKRGPIFSSKNPYRVLYRIAASHGIQFSAARMHRTCLAYAIASRCFHQHFLELAEIRRKWLFCPIAQDEAMRFFKLGASRSCSKQQISFR